jgi:hypothetical protein
VFIVTENQQRQVQDLLVFAMLVAIGVVGRWNQPEWCVTPTAATTIFAGLYFSRLAIAVLVPLTILAIGDVFLLPAHDSVPVIIATYAAMTFPVLLGRWLSHSATRRAAIWRWAACGFLPATVFFLTTNFAVWAFQSDYAKTLAGLAECYWAAVPFYRWMLAGDVVYLAVLFACWWLAGMPIRQLRHATQHTK